MDKYNLADCIVDEYLPLTAQMPIWEIAEKIREGHLHFEHESVEPLEEFQKNLEAFSAYLHQVVKGFHAIEEVEDDRLRLVGAKKILALRGDVVTLPLRLPPTLQAERPGPRRGRSRPHRGALERLPALVPGRDAQKTPILETSVGGIS